MLLSNDLLELSDKHEFLAFAVKDVKSDTYGTPAFWRTPVDAVRAFESGVLAQAAVQQGYYFTHPDDFVLCLVGAYDAASGSLTPLEPVQVIFASDVE